MKNPIYEWTEDNPVSNWDEIQGDRHLDLDLDGQDFDELHNFLDIKISPAERLEGENYGDFQLRIKNEYTEAAKEKSYEMLGRIWDWYDSVSYLPSEVDQLLEECLKFKKQSQNQNQLRAAEKLITACHEAFKTKSGIFLASD